MSKWNTYPKLFRLSALVAGILVMLLVGVVIAQSYRKGVELNSKATDDLFYERIKALPDSALTIEQDSDAPLKILEATVKKATRAEYESMTSKSTGFAEVLTAPTLKLKNVSDRTISRVTIVIEDPIAQRKKGISMRQLNIEPGAGIEVGPENFVSGQKMSTVGVDGKYLESKSSFRDGRYWLPFETLENLKVRVAVEFVDGDLWYNSNQRDGGNDE